MVLKGFGELSSLGRGKLIKMDQLELISNFLETPAITGKTGGAGSTDIKSDKDLTAKTDGACSSIRYPGGKGGAGVYQTLINLIPPHTTYIETHLGGGAIMRHKRPAAYSVGMDIDPAVIKMWRNSKVGRQPILINYDAASYLKDRDILPKTFIYCDPPYLMETRKSGPLYRFEYTTDQHIELLETIKRLPCMVMISGYYSDLYAEMLKGWNCKSFEAQTRQGKATEWVWFNYPEPTELHDYQYLGETFRERERISRKRKRWVNRLLSLPELERNALLFALNESIANDHTPNIVAPAGTTINDGEDLS